MGGRGSGRAVRLPPGWVQLSEAAEALGISPESLRDGIERGEITAYREFIVGGRMCRGFLKRDLGIEQDKP